jgi:RNA-binding protein 5/10
VRLKTEQKTEDQAPKYRDRASERRVMHNQPDAPAPSSSSSGGVSGNVRRSAPGPPKPPSPTPPPLNPGQDENNVGNKLLKMMGWTEGTGLGTNGEGRINPMYCRVSFPPRFSRSPPDRNTAIYAQGMGLGASKGKDIESISNGGHSSYNHTHEVARERYNDTS